MKEDMNLLKGMAQDLATMWVMAVLWMVMMFIGVVGFGLVGYGMIKSIEFGLKALGLT